MDFKIEKRIFSKNVDEKVELLDANYGDSDVYIVENSERSFVRKAYQPHRMLTSMKKVLNPNLPTYELIKNYLPYLNKIDVPRLSALYLESILTQYRADTSEIAKDVVTAPSVFRQKVDGNPEIKSISFEIVEQGDQLYRQNPHDLNSQIIVDGQELVEGKTLEQIMGIPDAQRRRTRGGDGQEFPRAFSRGDFVNEALHEFHTKFMQRFLDRQGVNKDALPVIFHRVHPANVIPKKVKDGHWKFLITDLSTILCLDYSIVLADQVRKKSF